MHTISFDIHNNRYSREKLFTKMLNFQWKTYDFIENFFLLFEKLFRSRKTNFYMIKSGLQLKVSLLCILNFFLSKS